jgi:hypothetical protein
MLKINLTFFGFGPGGDSRLSPNKAPEKSNGSWELPQWVSEFQKHAAFCVERLDWNKLRKGSSNAVFDFGGLLFFLFPNGVPLNQIVNLNLLECCIFPEFRIPIAIYGRAVS